MTAWRWAPGTRRFSGILSPGGVLMVEYRRSRGALQTLQVASDRMRLEGLDAGVERLCNVVESLGGRNGRLALALGGFGASHHILALPPADAALLRPVVTREMTRFYPDLRDPVVDFVLAGVAGRGQDKRDVLVGATPRRTVERIHEALADRGVTLDHLTVLPRVLSHLFQATDGSGEPSVLVAMTTTGPLVGCFYRGELRLYSEPPRVQPLQSLDGIVEHAERGALFLRQQFPSAGDEPVVVVAAADGVDKLAAAVSERMEAEVRTLDAPAGLDALVALGPAMDMAGDTHIDLLPRSLKPEPSADRWARALAVAAALVVGLAAVLWSFSAVEAARALDTRIDALEAGLDRSLVPVNEMRAVVDERARHAERLGFLAREARHDQEVQAMLRAVGDAAPQAVELSRVVVERDADLNAWRLVVAGVARGSGSAAAVRAVDGLYRGVPDRLPVDAVHLDTLEGALPDEAARSVAIDFQMSFIVRWGDDSGG